MRSVFERIGVGAEETVIVYCTIANPASQAWFGLTQLLGYPDVRVYYGSWVVVGQANRHPDRLRRPTAPPFSAPPRR